MTSKQEAWAEGIIALLKKKNGIANTDQVWYKKEEIGPHERLIITKALQEREIVEISGQQFRLTEHGWEFPGFEIERMQREAEKNRESEIKNLTVKQLKGDIFQLKHWWWILVINAIISGLVALVIQALTG